MMREISDILLEMYIEENRTYEAYKKGTINVKEYWTKVIQDEDSNDARS